ncbi:tail fiber domain-containing protein [Rhizobium bangladeshense]|uniref:tail fiber domain-containing protein n=1 Tax=Rhizobium bangladeshense TaxID=1138189 RepID=UPI001C914F9E|nr:tail fiber domain-containing protein [Rhizobium bangladeshense]MBY3597571.1 tail fiber domain-containing protein [Rhizobium bangladeshense]
MGKPKAPKAPDPKETAAAQTGTNVSTALANAQLQNVNQYGPDGSVTYSTNGYTTITDPTSGATYNIPRYTQTTSLSAAQQAIKDKNDAASLNLADIANNQSNFLKDYLSKPVDLSNDATEARLIELGRKRLDPMLAERDEALRTRLANQGVKAGSDAYGRELETARQSDNDAVTSLILNGRSQAVQEALTQRNQPINEIIGLLGGTQVGVPQFAAGTNQPSLPTVDYSGLVQSNYQNQMAAYQQQVAQRNNIFGGLFGAGAALLGNPALSDRRAKKDIKPVGKLMGHKVYEYRYRGKFDDGQTHVGVMAQEAEKTRPDAVSTRPDGLKQVNYGKLFQIGERMAA